MIPLMQMFEMGGVYISASRGAVEIIQAFEAIGVDVSNIHFLDLVSSGVLGGTDVPYGNITFIDSPIMLESILLAGAHTLRTVDLNQRISCSLTASMRWRSTTTIACWQSTCTPSSTRSASERCSLSSSMCPIKRHRWCWRIWTYCTDLVDEGQVVLL